MTINSSKLTNERDIRDFISKGGTVPGDHDADQDEAKKVQLRLYPVTISDIDAAREKRKKGKKLSRHAWILAAIEEKLVRDG
ncbi:hypothetical protein FNU79_17720 [Deinococcus detaillensis]|uniref:Uncharacterized protein n=1 Tax=Deinococcus detaillensis TaxID=2592048 RepID=A0A553UH28_9DEIO|nr:hypothetical protein FNU79_17720 [Deinococcus detaillensis]